MVANEHSGDRASAVGANPLITTAIMTSGIGLRTAAGFGVTTFCGFGWRAKAQTPLALTPKNLAHELPSSLPVPAIGGNLPDLPPAQSAGVSEALFPGCAYANSRQVTRQPHRAELFVRSSGERRGSIVNQDAGLAATLAA